MMGIFGRRMPEIGSLKCFTLAFFEDIYGLIQVGSVTITDNHR